MAYAKPQSAAKATQPASQPTGPTPVRAQSAGDGPKEKKKATHSIVLCDDQGEVVTWENIGATSTMLSTEVKQYGDQKNASVGGIWMAESGKSGFLRIGELTFKVFLNTPK